MAKYQVSVPTSTCVSSDSSFGSLLDFQLLGTYTDVPFMQICTEVATHCHCSMQRLPDLCRANDPTSARFQRAYARMDMVGPIFTDTYGRSGNSRQLTLMLLQNRTADFDRDVAPPVQLDIFERAAIDDDFDTEHYYMLNTTGYCFQKWDLRNITHLLCAFTDRDKDTPLFIEHIQRKLPLFDVDVTECIYRKSPQTSQSDTSGNTSAPVTAAQFLRGIVSNTQNIINNELKPRNPLFPQKSLLS